MIEFNINPYIIKRKNVLDENGKPKLDETTFQFIMEETHIPKTDDEILKEKQEILKIEKGKVISSLNQYNFVWANKVALGITEQEWAAKYETEIAEWYNAYNLLQSIQAQAIELGVEI